MAEIENLPVKLKPGRPKKADLEKAKNPGKVGRPVGTAARIKEFHARLLATNGDRVIETIIKKALDDEDKDQVACLKMCVDRLLPLSYFEKQNQAKGGIQINIVNTSEGSTTTIGTNDDDVIDLEFEEVDDSVEDLSIYQETDK